MDKVSKHFICYWDNKEVELCLVQLTINSLFLKFSLVGLLGVKMKHKCLTCGKDTDVCYTDAGVIGMVHGVCQCHDCYVIDGHPECPGCKELTADNWKYCSNCGIKL